MEEVVAILRSGITLEPDPRADAVFAAIRSEWERIGRVRYPQLGDDLEDAVQAALLKLLTPGKLASLAAPETVAVWARAVFLNTAIDFLRAGRRARGRFVLASVDDGPR